MEAIASETTGPTYDDIGLKSNENSMPTLHGIDGPTYDDIGENIDEKSVPTLHDITGPSVSMKTDDKIESAFDSSEKNVDLNEATLEGTSKRNVDIPETKKVINLTKELKKRKTRKGYSFTEKA